MRFAAVGVVMESVADNSKVSILYLFCWEEIENWQLKVETDPKFCIFHFQLTTAEM
jgi:hypothetical protein